MNRILSLILALNVSFTAIPLAHPGPGKGSPNRLVHEKSPYLLQHAYNPVNWYPWGEEAFSKAAEEDKPIFLSIGYSTCHWCHVMEKESFSNQETADLLNEDYVAIKVDREERPDIDSVYMNAVMKMTGSGGWPLTVILTPERKPFWGGTYFPPEDKNNRPGLKTILQNITAAWRSQREALIEDAETLTARLHPASDSMASMTVELDSKILDKAFDQLKNSYDSIHGGFGRAPKFPRPHNLLFLMRYWKQTQNPKALEMVEKTLQTMASGGIRDHLGGGFHRYSTDAKWRVPHFEKMLYDQALIAQAYLEAYQITQNSLYAEISRETLDYVLDKLTSPESGFYSAEDADSALTFDNKEKKEGAFYLWNAFELRKILPERDQELIFEHYGIEENGNIETDPHGEFDSRNLLYVSQNLAKLEKRYQKTRQEITEILEKAKSALKSQRETRPKPFLDDKILTDWNGLMIASFAVGARVLKENRYEKAARQAADFILKRMKGENGWLRHRYRTGEAAIEGFLDDYAFLSYGLLELYQTTFEPDYLEQALALAKIMMDQFWDEENGGFYLTSKGSEELITRSKELYDGAIPSGNSVAALVLLQANRLTMEDDFESKARQIHTTFSEALSGFPAYFTFMLIALDFMLGPSREIVIAGDPLEYETRQFIAEVFKHYLPKKVVALHEPFGKNKEAIEELVPFIESQVPINGKPTVYVCKNYVCDLPTTKVEQLKKLLAG